jgi:hypothetical protein
MDDVMRPGTNAVPGRVRFGWGWSRASAERMNSPQQAHEVHLRGLAATVATDRTRHVERIAVNLPQGFWGRYERQRAEGAPRVAPGHPNLTIPALTH